MRCHGTEGSGRGGGVRGSLHGGSEYLCLRDGRRRDYETEDGENSYFR